MLNGGSGSNKLSTGAVVGIVFACFAGVGLVFLCANAAFKQWRLRNPASAASMGLKSQVHGVHRSESYSGQRSMTNGSDRDATFPDRAPSSPVSNNSTGIGLDSLGEPLRADSRA